MLKQSEAVVLRSYAFREADLLVTFFTRNEGKVKGVARAAKKSKRRFGGALEPLTYVRVYYEDRERRDLARIDSCDVLDSPLTTAVDYPRAVALGYVAEVLDQLLPEREANDDLFRLSVSVLRHLQAGNVWKPLTYFDLWVARLAGILPNLHECNECGAALEEGRAWFHALADGLLCAKHKRLASSEIAAQSRALAQQMFRAPLQEFGDEPWPRSVAADLRKFIHQRIERHLDRKLVTLAMLEKI
jgi:DNA repair protein RecO (recombination protein O)